MKEGTVNNSHERERRQTQSQDTTRQKTFENQKNDIKYHIIKNTEGG